MYDYRRMTDKERTEVVRTRRERNFPLHAPPHIDSGPGIFLISAACFEHKPIFDSPELIAFLQDRTLNTLAMNRYRCDAWVFMPNHYHLLVHAESIEEFGEVMRKMHSVIATKVNAQHDERGRRVWYRHSDRKMRSDGHYWASINYIHRNPVKHSNIDDPNNWPWSSWLQYVEDNGQEAVDRLNKQYPPLDYGKGRDD
jgi:putative transposase